MAPESSTTIRFEFVRRSHQSDVGRRCVRFGQVRHVAAPGTKLLSSVYDCKLVKLCNIRFHGFYHEIFSAALLRLLQRNVAGWPLALKAHALWIPSSLKIWFLKKNKMVDGRYSENVAKNAHNDPFRNLAIFLIRLRRTLEIIS